MTASISKWTSTIKHLTSLANKIWKDMKNSVSLNKISSLTSAKKTRKCYFLGILNLITKGHSSTTE